MKIKLDAPQLDNSAPPEGYDPSIERPQFRGVEIYDFYHPDFNAVVPETNAQSDSISQALDGGGWVVDAGFNGRQEGLEVPSERRTIAEPEALPSDAWAAFKAGAVMENEMLSYLGSEVIELGQLPIDPNFIPQDQVSYSDPTYAPYQMELVRTQNQPEYDAMVRQIDREFELRRYLEANPVAGGVGMLATQAISPLFWASMLMPVYGAAGKGMVLKSAAELAFFGVAQEAIAEGVKLDAQITRTNKEAFINIAAAGLLSGAIGAGAGMYNKAKMDRMVAATAADLENPLPLLKAPETGDLSKMTPTEAAPYAKAGHAYDESLSAAKVDAPTLDDYGLVSTGLLIENIGYNPVVRLTKSASLTARKMTTWLVNNPMYQNGQLKGKNLSSPIGSVETRAAMLQNNSKALLIDTLRDQFAAYRGTAKVVDGQAKATGWGEFKTTVSDLTGRSGQEKKLPWHEFKQEISKSLRRGSKSDIPEVAASAQKIRDEIYLPYLEDLQKLEMIPEDIKIDGEYARTYLNRMFDHQKVARNRAVRDAEGNLVGGLEYILANHFEQTQKAISERVEKFMKVVKGDPISDEGYAIQLRAQKLEEDLANEVGYIKSAMTADFDPNKPADVKRILGLDEAPQSLAVALRKRGGIFDDGGELAARDINNKTYVGLVKKERSIQSNDAGGLASDKLREWLFDNDFRFGAKAYDDIDLNKVFDDLAEEVHDGKKIWGDDLQGRLGQHEGSVDQRGLSEYYAGGLGRRSSKKDIENYVHAHRGDTRERFEGELKGMRKEATDLQAHRVKALADREEMAEYLSLGREGLEALARDTVDNIQGIASGMAKMDFLPEGGILKASALRSRLLDIDDLQIEDFLEGDIETVVNAYVNTLAPQMEITRTFGEKGMNRVFEDIRVDYSNAMEYKQAAMREAGAADAAVEKEIMRLTKEQDAVLRDVKALQERVLGTYKRPDDPNAFWQRASQFVKRYNLIRLLGGMQLAAMPDIARPIMVKGFKPFMRTMKAINTSAYKMAAAEARKAAVGLEALLNGRLKDMADISEMGAKRTRAEELMDSAAMGFGKVTGMSQHNDFVKSFSGVMVQDDILRAARTVMDGGALSKKQLRDMAKSGLGRGELDDIAKELKAGKFTDESGLLIPHSDTWDMQTRQAMFSAISKSVDEIIVTVGKGDAPLWMSSELGSFVTQFKSFMVSSHSRVLISGLQARDAAALEGTLISIGLGYGVYSLKNALAGRETDGDFGNQLLEASDRSGVFGMLGESYAIANKISGGTLSATGGGQTLTRMQSRNMMDTFLGASFGGANDLMALSRAGFTGEVSEGDINTARKMLPYQNLWYMDYLFDSLQEGAKDNFVTN